MYEVEIYGRVRRAVRVEGKSQRAVAREFGLSRDTVRKMLQYAVPPGYQRQQPIKRPKLGAWLGVIDAILDDDKQRPAKQRHTAKRIFERLRDEHGYQGGQTVVKDAVRAWKQSRQEVFLPLSHPPGEAQVDFGEATIWLAGLAAEIYARSLPDPPDDNLLPNFEDRFQSGSACLINAQSEALDVGRQRAAGLGLRETVPRFGEAMRHRRHLGMD